MTKNEWFAEVRWCEDDIRARLEDRGIEVTEEVIASVRSDMEKHWFADQLIEYGWRVMDAYIDDATREHH